MKNYKEHFTWLGYGLFLLLTLGVMLLCVCAGSVTIPLGETWKALWSQWMGSTGGESVNQIIILTVRFPRVLCVALVGASLALCGAAMQGLLRNPLADGSTLGVSTGASMGAVIAISFGVSLPGLPFAGTMGMAVLFAFFSLVLILGLAYRLDASLETNTIILIGVVFSMFANSVISFMIVFAGEKIRSITFWTMGSLAQSSYMNALVLLFALLLFGGVLLGQWRELNAFVMGEAQAHHIGVAVKKVKLWIMISVSCLIGVCVSIGGSISFVGLVIPHMVRLLIGPNHKRLLPASIFSGAIFLMLADLLSRVVLRPLELPIGVVTSFVGSVVFVYIFYTARKGKP